ncbi:MAG: tRNA (N(6)-L-threonylcarbamoyladenosine(37)-C(2))-methylthiotransferase MtaB [Acidobacteria bacterium RIFCSPLOWO2_12_FULL_67_14b]|nr:MAG: tRNA (N(6)-L-threonylcarbamoyladenosine(37)-C(2))-methylthiotransferase MtaB [Acidobacteria bacterium RIFCSPLOWO2_12_FULL_67_14b]
MKYSIITLGCRVNQADSLGFEEAFQDAGASAAPHDQADLVVVNTCSVTASADQSARQTIRRVARDNPRARIVVTGCYATRRPDEVCDLPNVARVLSNDDKPRLVQILRRLDAGGAFAAPEGRSGSAETTTAERFGEGEGSCGASIEPGVAGRTAFTLRVQTGCGEPCAYCIIPTTRGRPRSTPLRDLVREADRVTAAGFKEIVLTGVHLGSYGRDLAPRTSLATLLRALTTFVRGRKPRQEVLFRISSLEPMDCTTEIVDLVANEDCFAPHFHLPLQHASHSVLTRMRRPYTIEQYADLVDAVRTRIPHAAIGSDVIVGFPGESDDDFDRLASYLETSPLTHIHVFPYSDRPGTEASAMADKVRGATIRDRGRRVREISARLSDRFRTSQVGAVHRALTLEDGSLVVTGNYLKVRVPPQYARNEWVSVRIVASGDLLSGCVS